MFKVSVGLAFSKNLLSFILSFYPLAYLNVELFRIQTKQKQ